ncbi:MAG: hypothetical protein KatS3mg127_1052 [Silanimonas sp.]|nr:MAG: hypothetical protein KatS3mg127_1052 [Silanimonas sp.]
MLTVSRLGVIALLLALAGGGAAAPADGAEVQRFATGEFLPYIDLRTAEGGFYPALIRRVLAEHGEAVEFVERPWARAHAETAAGRIEAVSAGIYNGRATLQRMYGEASPIVPVGEALDNETLHLVWPRSRPESEGRRAAFNASLAALRQRGEVAALEARLLPRAH